MIEICDLTERLAIIAEHALIPGKSPFETLPAGTETLARTRFAALCHLAQLEVFGAFYSSAELP